MFGFLIASNKLFFLEIPKKIYREVVLLTEDRNLRVKALSSNMPVQTVSDFVKWAGLN